MLNDFAATHTLIAITIAVFVSFYFTGVYLMVASFAQKPEWFEDENGDLHYVPRDR
jgi:hypothetical protein